VSVARFTRQTRLPEIGRAGQARLEATVIDLATRGEAAVIEAAYVRAGGAAGVRPLAEGAAEHALPFDVRDPAARDVATGAHAALAAMRLVWLAPGGPP